MSTTAPAPTPLFPYRLYLYRDRNDDIVFRAQWKWGPFWLWLKRQWFAYDSCGTEIAEWGNRDAAMRDITKHADSRRLKLKPLRTQIEVKEISV